MDVVPAFVAVDGVRFPLAVSEQGVRLADDTRYPGLNALTYVAGHLIAMRTGAARVAELTARTSFVQPQVLAASVIDETNRDDLGDGVANWTRLAGAPPDLDDAYLVGTPWLAAGIVVPRRTLIRLIEQVGRLHDAVLAHRLEPRLAGTPEAGPVNPPPAPGDDAGEDESDDESDDDPDADDSDDERDADDTDDVSASSAAANGHAAGSAAPAPASASAPPARIADDDLLRDIEALAAQVDELDAAARRGDVPYANVERSAAAAAKRQRLFIELEVAGLLAPALTDPALAALTRLGLTRLLGYVEAARALAAYLASPERAARFPGQAVPGVTAAVVSLDWFRTPSGYRPEGVTEHEWLALCEKNFASPVPASPAGVRFVRLCGAMHQLRYRAEVGAAPCLWRAELAT